MRAHDSTDVLIVGAGPTGLTLACELARRHVPCRIIDQNSGPSQHTKALGVHSRSLELFERLDVAEEMCRRGREIHGLNVYDGKEQLLHIDVGKLPTQYPYVLSLPQSETERILIERLSASGVEVEWNTELTDIFPVAEGVESHLNVGNLIGACPVRTKWLVGCDGAHSTVRHCGGFSFRGQEYADEFDLMDAKVDWGLSHDEAHAFITPGGFLGAIPLPEQGAYRLIAGEPAGTKTAVSLSAFQRWMDERCQIPAAQGAKVRDPIWQSQFHISRRMVSQFCSGNVYVAGDAAHIHSPVGAQGMNAGVQDAMNLGWKIALVQQGASPASLLDSYHGERFPIARSLLWATDLATRLITVRQPIFAALRNRLAAWLLDFESMQQRLSEELAELRMDYRHSPIVHNQGTTILAAGPLAGDRAPDAEVQLEPSRMVRLYDWLRGTDHVLFVFSPGPDPSLGNRLRQFRQLLADRYSRNVDVCVVHRSAAPPAGLPEGTTTALDGTGDAHRRYHADRQRTILVRPDSYIGYCGEELDSHDLHKYFSRIFVPSRHV